MDCYFTTDYLGIYCMEYIYLFQIIFNCTALVFLRMQIVARWKYWTTNCEQDLGYGSKIVTIFLIKILGKINYNFISWIEQLEVQLHNFDLQIRQMSTSLMMLLQFFIIIICKLRWMFWHDRPLSGWSEILKVTLKAHQSKASIFYCKEIKTYSGL